MRPEPALSYVRDLLEGLTGSRPNADGDGDLPVRVSGAEFYVRVVGDDAIVQVFSVVLAGVDATAELLVALNGINTQSKFVRAFHVANQVLFEHEIWADDVNPANFGYACTSVAAASDRFGHELHAQFGGDNRFELSKNDEYEQPEMFGGYL